MSVRNKIEMDIQYELDNVDFEDINAVNNSYQHIKSYIEFNFINKNLKDYSLSFDDIVKLVNILNDDREPLKDSYLKMLEFLGRDYVGMNKVSKEFKIKKQIYTIEFGNIEEIDGYYEKIKTSETSYITKEEYETALSQFLTDSINNDSQLGFYIECYFDEEILTEHDLEMLKEYDYIDDPRKDNLIQQFMIDNTGKCIDYIH